MFTIEHTTIVQSFRMLVNPLVKLSTVKSLVSRSDGPVHFHVQSVIEVDVSNKPLLIESIFSPGGALYSMIFALGLKSSMCISISIWCRALLWMLPSNSLTVFRITGSYSRLIAIDRRPINIQWFRKVADLEEMFSSAADSWIRHTDRTRRLWVLEA